MKIFVDSLSATSFESGHLLSHCPGKIYLSEDSTLRLSEYCLTLLRDRVAELPTWIYCLCPLVTRSVVCQQWARVLCILPTANSGEYQSIQTGAVSLNVTEFDSVQLALVDSELRPFPLLPGESFCAVLEFSAASYHSLWFFIYVGSVWRLQAPPPSPRSHSYRGVASLFAPYVSSLP